MVTSLDMMKTEMGDCRSKSGILPVKEQRVDGSWCNKPLHLRYTLIVFERNNFNQNPF